jgi:hypothetical protein
LPPPPWPSSGRPPRAPYGPAPAAPLSEGVSMPTQGLHASHP